MAAPLHDKRGGEKSDQSCDQWSRWKSCTSLLTQHSGLTGSCTRKGKAFNFDQVHAKSGHPRKVLSKVDRVLAPELACWLSNTFMQTRASGILYC